MAKTAGFRSIGSIAAEVIERLEERRAGSCRDGARPPESATDARESAQRRTPGEDTGDGKTDSRKRGPVRTNGHRPPAGAGPRLRLVWDRDAHWT